MNPHGLSWVRDLGFGCWARGDGKWADRPRLFSPKRVRVNSPVEFTQDYLFPSPRARDTVYFGIDDILLTAASDSEDFVPTIADALPLSGQEARPSPAYSELVDVLSRATEELAMDLPDEPRESRSSKLDERFLSGSNSKPEWRKLPFFGDLHQEISRSWKQPFSSRLTNAAAADFTNLVVSVEQGYTAMPVVEDTLASHLSSPLWRLRGSPAPSFRPNRVGLLPLSSGSPTLRLVRQAWPSIRWPSFKPTRQTSLRKWTRGLVWLQRLWKSCAEPLTWLSEPLNTLYGGFGGRGAPFVAKSHRDTWEGEGVLTGRTHLTVWAVRGSG